MDTSPKGKRTGLRDGCLIGIGNALLDVTAQVDENFLRRHGIGVDQSVKADNDHTGLLDELESRYTVRRTPGGSGLNVLRAVQWVLGQPDVCTFMGCVGDDENAKFLLHAAKEAGVHPACQVAAHTDTSLCVVLVTGAQRSMCSFQLASGKFEYSKYLQPAYQTYVDKASFIYLSGFFLNVCTKTARSIAVHAQETGKSLILDLGAPRVCLAQRETFRALIPFADVLFGNDAEFTAFAEILSIQKADVKDVCVAISKLPKASSNSARIVLMTCGAGPVCLASPEGYSLHPCLPVPLDELVDVNGAGDAFLGGFLSQYIQNAPVDHCVATGLYVASTVVQQSGCTFPSSPPVLPRVADH